MPFNKTTRVDRRNTVFGMALNQCDDAVRMWVGQRLQQRCVHECEYGGICADTERQRQHRNRGEATALAPPSQGGTKIFRDSFEQDPSPHFPTRLLQQCDVTERAMRFVLRGVLIDSHIQVFLPPQLLMELHFFVEITFELLAVHEESEPSPKLAQPVTHSARPPSDRLARRPGPANSWLRL